MKIENTGCFFVFLFFLSQREQDRKRESKQIQRERRERKRERDVKEGKREGFLSPPPSFSFSQLPALTEFHHFNLLPFSSFKLRSEELFRLSFEIVSGATSRNLLGIWFLSKLKFWCYFHPGEGEGF